MATGISPPLREQFLAVRLQAEGFVTVKLVIASSDGRLQSAWARLPEGDPRIADLFAAITGIQDAERELQSWPS